MDAWQQRHDHSLIEHHGVGLDDGLALLAGFEWGAELDRYEAALEEQRDRCPPGMGFLDGERLLHVLPIRDGHSHYHYSRRHQSRLFSLFGGKHTLDAWNIPDEHRPRLVGLHYDGKEQDLVNALRELGKDRDS